MELIHSGKVREVYADGKDLLLVASDRVSIYDVVLLDAGAGQGPGADPALAVWWFDRLTDIVPNHVISATDVPAEWACPGQPLPAAGHGAGRVHRPRLPIRSRPVSYNETGAVSGRAAPGRAGRGVEAARAGVHRLPGGGLRDDEPMTYDEVVDLVGAQTAAELKRITLAVYQRGADLAAERGVIVADTKLEFGMDPDGALVLADEVLTPDSSRYWPADGDEPGHPQFAYDKQFLARLVHRDPRPGLARSPAPPGAC